MITFVLMVTVLLFLVTFPFAISKRMSLSPCIDHSQLSSENQRALVFIVHTMNYNLHHVKLYMYNAGRKEFVNVA